MVEPEKAIELVHSIAAAEIAYDYVLNNPIRGIKGATRTMERVRLDAFQAMVGRKPTEEERQALLFGDS